MTVVQYVLIYPYIILHTSNHSNYGCRLVSTLWTIGSLEGALQYYYHATPGEIF